MLIKKIGINVVTHSTLELCPCFDSFMIFFFMQKISMYCNCRTVISELFRKPYKASYHILFQYTIVRMQFCTRTYLVSIHIHICIWTVMINCSVKEHLVPSLLSSPICYVSATRTVKEASLQKLQRRRKVLKYGVAHWHREIVMF